MPRKRYYDIVKRKELMYMDGFENFIYALDCIMDTPRKRHIIGGILLSASLLFGGLSITVFTIKNEEE